MKNFFCRSTHILFATLTVMLFWTRDAHAYLDPGTGSMLLQMLAAGILGALFTIKTYWKKLGGFFKNLLGKNNADDQE